MPDHPLDARAHVFRPLLDFRVGIRPELQVDAPDVVRLFVQERRFSRMKRRIEPEPALGREFRIHPHVGDEELILKGLADEIGADHTAQARTRAVTGDHVIGGDGIGTFRRVDRQTHMVVRGLQAYDLITPAQINPRHLGDALAQEFFGVILLQIDEGRHFVPAFRQEVEAIDELFAEKNPADLPDDPLFHHALGDAEAVPIFE